MINYPSRKGISLWLPGYEKSKEGKRNMENGETGQKSGWITLEKYIEKMGIFTFKESMMMLEPIYNDIHALHEKGSCHGAVTSKNILVYEPIWSCCRPKSEAQIQIWKKGWKAAPTMLTGAAETPKTGMEEVADQIQKDICGLAAVLCEMLTGKCARELFKTEGAGNVFDIFGLETALSDGTKEAPPVAGGQKESILMADGSSGIGTGILRDSGINRSEITTIIFVDNLAEASEGAWDVSERKDRSVLAWTKRKAGAYDLYIAGSGKVTANENCRGLFALYRNLVQIKGMEIFDTGRTTDMSQMFWGCQKLTKLDVSRFDTSQVTNMKSMFYGCESLKELDVRGFNTSRVINMGWMFGRCENLKELDLRGFNISQVKDMCSMFCGCKRLEKIDTSRFDTSQVTDKDSMFEGCKSLRIS